VIRRRGLQFIDAAISDQQCQYCRHEIAGVGLGT
jgi:hypothetical protein